MINVVNKYKHDSTDHDFYIGRGSPLGNPYSSKESSKEYVTLVESRDKAVEKFENWLKKKISSGDKEIITEILKILRHEREHEEVNLVCFCKPKKCHGDVIKKVLNKIKNEKKDLINKL